MPRSAFLIALLGSTIATPALAGSYDVGGGFKMTPLIDLRLRYEHVNQDNALESADAATARARAGFEVGNKVVSFLAEAEGTLALSNDYNSTTNGRTTISTVPDPENVELNRLQVQFKGLPKTTITAGRQRINIDDQRFVGSVGWRQNEQTFDAVRLETAALGPVTLDVTYAWSDRTIFGIDAGTRQAFEGDNFFINSGVKLGPVAIKGFAYLIEQEDRAAFSSQTYGVRASGKFPLGKGADLALVASYATQSDWKANPANYKADYILLEATATMAGFGLTAGYELLGSDNGVAAFQTPLATLHKFQGWADQFLTTPARGIEDIYAGVTYKFPTVKALPGLNAAVTYHSYDSDVGGVSYGDEWNAQLGFKVKMVAVQVKYATYNAKAFSVDTDKLWLQLEWKY